MLGMVGIFMTIMAEAHIHQALAASTDYVAQHCYVKQRMLDKDSADKSFKDTIVNVENLVDTAMIQSQFHSYMGNDFYVERMISGGKYGITISVKKDRTNKKIMLVTAVYEAKVYLPLLGTYSVNLSNRIKQKAFVGFSEEEYNNKDSYVFITPNREAYHMRRDCTHLLLDVNSVSSTAKGVYKPCYYCGWSASGSSVYIAKNGEVYHNRRDCVGLKRTVRRVKKSSVEDISACERCGG